MPASRSHTEVSSFRKPSLLFGAVTLSMGIYGIYDEYFAVVEFIKGFVQPLFALVGLVTIMAGLFTYKPNRFYVVVGVGLLGFGIYGFFDEYYATLDFFKGAIPPILLVLGFVSVASGVKQLE